MLRLRRVLFRIMTLPISTTCRKSIGFPARTHHQSWPARPATQAHRHTSTPPHKSNTCVAVCAWRCGAWRVRRGGACAVVRVAGLTGYRQLRHCRVDLQRLGQDTYRPRLAPQSTSQQSRAVPSINIDVFRSAVFRSATSLVVIVGSRNASK